MQKKVTNSFSGKILLVIRFSGFLFFSFLLFGCSGRCGNRIIFGDECSGTIMDQNKWDVQIEDLKNIQLTHYHALELHIRKPEVSNALVRSAIGSKKGFFSFSVFSNMPVNLRTNTPLPVTTKFGLYIDSDNRIEFYHKLSGNYMLAYRIVKSGETVYEVDDIAKEFGQFKIKISNRSITAYIWENDRWILIGEPQVQTLPGKKHIFMSADGVVSTKMSIRDCYITTGDFATVTPVLQSSPEAVDIRAGGAAADGETDCAGVINKLLEEGDVIIQNGRFLIRSSILIPSDRTLYIRNATIRIGDQVFDNMFRNKDIFTGNTNVNILGLGNAVLDANAVNNNRKSENYPVPSDLLTEYKYKLNVVFLGNTSGFEIAGLNEVDRPCYFMALQDDSFGKIHDIYNSIYCKT